MKLSFSNVCEVCRRSKKEGDHSACSKKKQAERLALEKAKKPKAHTGDRTYNNNPQAYRDPRQLEKFLKTLGQ